jgi:hypothetical protein
MPDATSSNLLATQNRSPPKKEGCEEMDAAVDAGEILPLS